MTHTVSKKIFFNCIQFFFNINNFVYCKFILFLYVKIFIFFLVHIREEPGIEPDHTVGLKLFALELRLDYMGTSVLMSRVSSLDVTLRDEWKINRNNKEDAFMPTRRFVNLNKN